MDFPKATWQLKRQPLAWGLGNVCGTTPLRQSNRLNLNTPEGRVAASALSPVFSQKRHHVLSGTLSGIPHAEKITEKDFSQEVPHSSMAGSIQSSSCKKSLTKTDVPRILARKIDEEMYRSIWARRPLMMTNQENIGVANSPFRSVPRRSNRKGKQGSSRRQPHNFITQDTNGICENNISNTKQEQECCRTLQFDDNKGISDEEVTQPLDMMDMTAMISGASVFQDPQRFQRIEKPQSQRKVNFSDRTSRYENRVEKQEIFNNCFEDIGNYSKCAEVSSNSNCILPKKTVPSRIPPPKIKINETITAENVGKQTNKSRIQKRRSAIPTFKVTPKYKIKRDLRSKSTSKLSIPLEHHQKDSVQCSSNFVTRCSTRNISRRSAVAEIPKIVIEAVVDEVKPSKVDTAVNTDPVEKCDAATNTSVQYGHGESLKSDLVREVQKLNEEMDEIKRKADLICEQTVARRKRMKESHVLENFMTSISPLKRIHAMLEENNSSHVAHEDAKCSRVSSVPETNMASCSSTESLCLDNCDMDLTNPSITTGGDSPMDQSVFNTTSDMNVSQSKWKHLKLNSRVFHTPSTHPQKRKILLSSPPEVEHFHAITEDEVSPFTEMAGDCERPSLAPMTPHSHKQVSLLKLNLRKQLDQLFE